MSNIYHLEVLKKSYEVIVKSLAIRLKEIEVSSEDYFSLRDVLSDKIEKFNMRIENVERRLAEKAK